MTDVPSYTLKRFSLGGVARGLVGLPGEAVLHTVVELATVVAFLLGVGGVPVGCVSILGILAIPFAAAVALLVSVVGLGRVVLLHEVDEHLLQGGVWGLLWFDGEHLGFLGSGPGSSPGFHERCRRTASSWSALTPEPWFEGWEAGS